MTYAYILALDPSGSFYEGKGTTGWCILEQASQTITLAGELKASEHNFMEAYWQAHLQMIAKFRKRYGKRMIIILEDYFLYAQKASAQINSRFETSKLIGVIQHYCFMHNIPYIMQTASTVKIRWTDSILHYKNYICKRKNKFITPTGHPLTNHSKDAIRHAVHFSTFKNKGENNENSA